MARSPDRVSPTVSLVHLAAQGWFLLPDRFRILGARSLALGSKQSRHGVPSIRPGSKASGDSRNTSIGFVERRLHIHAT